MIFCTVHFKKGVDQAAGINENFIIRKIIFSLLNITNRNHYFNILDVIKDKKSSLNHTLININDLLNICQNKIA
jgi:hypothetical protein